jgi:hypothetical protein
VLEFDDNDVDCERVDEIVVFVRVGVVFDEIDCGTVVEVDNVEEVEIGEIGVIDDGMRSVDNGVFDEEGGNGISKISTISEYPLELFPPPKNILFIDDVDASPTRG